MRLLGLDYGEAKIGLAFADGPLAEPLGIVKIVNFKSPALPARSAARRAGRQISNLCRQYEIEKIVMGISEGKMAEKQRRFGKELAKITNLPVEFQSEILTTKEALSKMREIGRRVKNEDAYSAALILQAYLDHV